MKFNVDSDEGDVIRLWVTLDHPSDVPSLVVRCNEQVLTRIVANHNRPDLRDHDLHTTGQAGFIIDDTVVPRIAQQPALELLEETSGLPIYARFQPDRHLRKRFLIWGRSSQFLRRDSGVLNSKFSLVYRDLDKQNSETIASVLSSEKSDSVFAVGRPNLLRCGELIERQKFETAVVISDPYIDLAERLIELRQSIDTDSTRPDRSDLAKHVQDIDLGSSRALTRLFRTLKGSERMTFRSPIVRALTRAPEEDVRRQDVSIALKVLAKFSFVCTDQTMHLLAARLETILNVSDPPRPMPAVVELAGIMRSIGAVSDILNEDAALYNYVSRAVATAQSRLSSTDRVAQ